MNNLYSYKTKRKNNTFFRRVLNMIDIRFGTSLNQNTYELTVDFIDINDIIFCMTSTGSF